MRAVIAGVVEAVVDGGAEAAPRLLGLDDVRNLRLAVRERAGHGYGVGPQQSEEGDHVLGDVRQPDDDPPAGPQAEQPHPGGRAGRAPVEGGVREAVAPRTRAVLGPCSRARSRNRPSSIDRIPPPLPIS